MSSYGRRAQIDADGCVSAIGYMILALFVLAISVTAVGWFFTPKSWCANYKNIETYEDQSVGFGGKERVLVIHRVCTKIETGTSPARDLWHSSLAAMGRT